MLRLYRSLAILVIFVFFAIACSSQQTATPELTLPTIEVVATETQPMPTIDPCMPPYSMQLAQRVHAYMREFDDASTLAASLTVDRVPDSVAELQRIRRAAEDELVPACLSTLKEKELAHMNAVINTLLGMLNGIPAEDLQKGIDTARTLHDEYALELAVLMGATIVAPSAVP